MIVPGNPGPHSAEHRKIKYLQGGKLELKLPCLKVTSDSLLNGGFSKLWAGRWPSDPICSNLVFCTRSVKDSEGLLSDLSRRPQQEIMEQNSCFNKIEQKEEYRYRVNFTILPMRETCIHAAWDRPWMDFPTAYCADSVREGALPLSHAVVSFILHNKQNNLSSSDSLDCHLSHNTYDCTAQAITGHSSRFPCSSHSC